MFNIFLSSGRSLFLKLGNAEVWRYEWQGRIIKVMFLRVQGWKNECIGYHITGDIFDAVNAKTNIEIEGLIFFFDTAYMA